MKYICLLILLVSGVACSTRHDDSLKALIPVQDSLGDYTATAQPNNVPPTLGQYTYFGLKPLVVDEFMEFNLLNGTGKKVVDFEFVPENDETLQIAQFSHDYVGECSGVEVGISWYRLDKKGNVFTVIELTKYDSISVKANIRQLMRIEFINTEKCSQVYSTLEITKY